MVSLTKEQKLERVAYHQGQMLKRFLILQIPFAVFVTGAAWYSLLPEVATPPEKIAALGVLAVGFVTSGLRLAEFKGYADRANQEYRSWNKETPFVTEGLELPPPVEMKLIPKSTYETSINVPSTTVNAVAKRVSAMHETGRLLLSPKSKEKPGMEKERALTLQRIKEKLIRPVTSMSGLPMTEAEKEVLFKTILTASVFEQAPEVLDSYIRLISHILRNYLGSIDLKETPADKSIMEQLVTTAIRHHVNSVPLTEQDMVHRIKKQREERLTVTNEEAIEFAKRLVACSHRGIPQTQKLAVEEIRKIMSELHEKKLDTGELAKTLNMYAFVFRPEMQKNFNFVMRVDPLWAFHVKENHKQGTEYDTVSETVSIRARDIIDADEAVCAFVLLYPVFKKIIVEIDKRSHSYAGTTTTLNLDEVYEKRLVGQDEHFITGEIIAAAKNNSHDLIKT